MPERLLGNMKNPRDRKHPGTLPAAFPRILLHGHPHAVVSVRGLRSSRLRLRSLQVSFPYTPRQRVPSSPQRSGAPGEHARGSADVLKPISPHRPTAGLRSHYQKPRYLLPSEPGPVLSFRMSCNVSILVSSVISFQISAFLQESAGELICQNRPSLLSLTPVSGISPNCFYSELKQTTSPLNSKQCSLRNEIVSTMNFSHFPFSPT